MVADVSGFEYLNVFPLFDWRHVPGTTVELLPGSSDMTCADGGKGLCPKYRGSSRFVGGVDANASGVFAFDMTPMEYHEHSNSSLRAHKSWFYFGDASLISCVDEISATNRIVTTLEQAWADIPTADGIAIEQDQSVNGTEFTNNGFVYRSLTHGAQLQGSVRHRAANWTTVAMEYGDYPSSAGEVFTLSFAHGEEAAPLCYSVAVRNENSMVIPHAISLGSIKRRNGLDQ